MNLVKKEVEVCKESSEVFAALAVIVADIKAKKEVAAIVAGALPALVAAVDGFQQLPEEVKAAQFPQTAALGLAELVSAILN